jgi:hypothetical protein
MAENAGKIRVDYVSLDEKRLEFRDVLESHTADGWTVWKFEDRVLAIPDRRIEMIEIVEEEA